jgi:hypothetical protein
LVGASYTAVTDRKPARVVPDGQRRDRSHRRRQDVRNRELPGIFSPHTGYREAVADVVLGRREELRQVGLFLDSVVNGAAGCVFQGAAGIGKTALWREGVVAAQARSYRVLCCAPAEVAANADAGKPK